MVRESNNNKKSKINCTYYPGSNKNKTLSVNFIVKSAFSFFILIVPINLLKNFISVFTRKSWTSHLNYLLIKNYSIGIFFSLQYLTNSKYLVKGDVLFHKWPYKATP